MDLKHTHTHTVWFHVHEKKQVSTDTDGVRAWLWSSGAGTEAAVPEFEEACSGMQCTARNPHQAGGEEEGQALILTMAITQFWLF